MIARSFFLKFLFLFFTPRSFLQEIGIGSNDCKISIILSYLSWCETVKTRG